jgi:hypothetical protein
VFLSREELDRIPLRYRWLVKLFLKLPNPGFPYFVLKKLPEIDGIFWAIVTPILLTLYFLSNIWLIAFLSLHFSFPFNLLLGLFIPAVIFVFFLRIQLERTILWWKSLQNSHNEWDISKAVEELVELTRKQRRRQD